MQDHARNADGAPTGVARAHAEDPGRDGTCSVPHRGAVGVGAVLDPALVEFIQGGVAVGVATRDDDMRPEFARGWGPEVSADGRSLRLCVAAPEGSRMRANLGRNGAVAVGFSPPTIARAVQVKGAATRGGGAGGC